MFSGKVTFYLCFNPATPVTSCSSDPLQGRGTERQQIGTSIQVSTRGPGFILTSAGTNPQSIEIVGDRVGYYMFFADLTDTRIDNYEIDLGARDNGDNESFWVLPPRVIPTPTPTPSPTAEPKLSPEPTPTPTPTETPRPTPSSKPTPIPLELPDVPKIKIKEVDMRKVESKNITVAPCGKSVTFKMVGPDGAIFKIEKVPSRGTLSKIDDVTLVWTPDPTFCNTSLGGNDGFVYSWKDPKGNVGVVTKVFMLELKGDVPKDIVTGLGDGSDELTDADFEVLASIQTHSHPTAHPRALASNSTPTRSPSKWFEIISLPLIWMLIRRRKSWRA